MLTEARYWSEAFCLLYFNQCDEVLFEDPISAIPMAEIGLTLVSRVAPEHCNGGKQRLQELEVLAQCVLGSALRAAGRLEAADEVYEKALEVEGIAQLERANLLARVAILRKYQRRFSEAESLITRAIKICRQEKGEELLGMALVMRGGLYLSTDAVSDALRDLSAALPLIKEKKNPRVYRAALHNLAGCLYHDEARLEDLADVLKNLRKARRTHRGRWSLPKLKLRWLEGLIEVKFGFVGQGVMSLLTARQGFVVLGVVLEVALIAVDLSVIYLEEGRFDELRQLASETYKLCQSSGLTQDARSALLLWYQAVRGQRLTSEVIATVREALQEAMAPDPTKDF